MSTVEEPVGDQVEPALTEGSFSKPVLNDAQQDVLDRLRSVGVVRPAFEPGLREHLRLELERGMAPLIELLGEEDLYLSKHKLEQVHGCEGKFLAEEDIPFEWSVPIARGLVAHRAIEIQITSRTRWSALDLVDEAIARFQNDGRGVGEWLQRATEAEVDMVRAEANNALCSFQDCWPPLARKWRPATEVPMRAEFFAGRIVLTGKPDLTIGFPEGQTAGKVVVDFKTGRQSPAHVADLRFYALLDALRVGVPPRQLVTYYLDSATMHSEEVTNEILDATVARTVGAARRIVELRVGEREPRLAPSAVCSWCPALSTCAVGRAYRADRDEGIGDPDADD